MTKSLKRSIDEVNVNCRKLKREIILKKAIKEYSKQ